MLFEHILQEGTDNLYHYTSPHAALKIFTSGEFQFTSSIGTDTEKKWQHKGYEYYLSCTRSKVGDYHMRPGYSGVIFNLDGRWIGQRYPVKPVDYWERMWYNSQTGGTHSGRTTEAEDRIYSKSATMPITPVQQVHIYWNEKGNDDQNFVIRRLMIESKKRGIPTYLYENEKDWYTQNINKAISVHQAAEKEKLQGPEKHAWGGGRQRDDYLNAWVELYYKKSDLELSDKGKRQFRDLRGWGDVTPGLKNDLHNARTPTRTGYKAAQEIIKIMRANKWTDVSQFVEFLKQKWEKIAEVMRKREREEWEKQQAEKQKAAANESRSTMSPDDILNYIDQNHTGPSNLDPDDEDGLYQWVLRYDYFDLQDVPVADLSLQAGSNQQTKINQYAQSATEFPPIVIAGDSGWIMDGYHRANAAAKRGDKTIKAYVGKYKTNESRSSILEGIEQINEVPSQHHMTFNMKNWSNLQEVRAWLKQNGYKRLGKGAYAEVWKNESDKKVVKISTTEDACWVRYVRWVQAQPKSKYLPVIYSFREYQGKIRSDSPKDRTLFIAVIEALEESDSFKKRLRQKIASEDYSLQDLALYVWLQYIGYNQYYNTVSRLMNSSFILNAHPDFKDLDGKQRAQKLLALFSTTPIAKLERKINRELAGNGCFGDLHFGNIMYRASTNNLVITDPLAE